MTGLLWAVWIIVGLLIYISILLTTEFNNKHYYTEDLLVINKLLRTIKDSNDRELKLLFSIISDNGKTLAIINEDIRSILRRL